MYHALKSALPSQINVLAVATKDFSATINSRPKLFAHKTRSKRYKVGTLFLICTQNI